MSLRDQLLKSGLVSREKVEQVEAEARKHKHQTKKNKSVSAAEAARQAEENRRREAEAARKRERDRKLNREREAERQRKEDVARARQLIAGNRLNEVDAQIRYHFVAGGRRVRSVRVTAQQQRLLAMGRIGIARNEENKYDFPLIPREVALKLAELSPDKLLLLYPESDGVEDDEGWDG